ncbi:hypothetical protein G6L37_00550 [Agrobacterium rubi]|nr:hypothetical protein [Agrobacterium rubi]NTF23879.1 hypothetical protein [Agrobacterium rubi]
MNPFSQNPFHFADTIGPGIAKRGIALAYRRWRISPVMSRHVPRIVFVLAFALMSLNGPADRSVMLFAVAGFILFALVRMLPDVKDMRTEWNADLYRTYGAEALKQRDIRMSGGFSSRSSYSRSPGAWRLPTQPGSGSPFHSHASS